jgi:xylulokinase
MPACFLGLDIGTTTAKAAIVRPDGKVLASVRERYAFSFPRPGWVEQNPEDWWQAIGRLVRRLKREAPAALRGVAAAGVSGQGCPLVTVNRQGRCLRPAILWLDTRAADEAAWMASEVGELLLRINGNRVGTYNLAPKALWLRRHEPRVFERSFKFLTTVGYVNFRLTGEWALNHSDGGILFEYDRERRNWSQEALARLGLPLEKYPRLAECHEVMGRVSARAAKETGLPAGLPVVAGGEDTSSAALAAGAVEAGDAYLSMGTAAVLGVVLRERVNEPRLLSFPHVLPGRTLLSGSMSTGGAALEWYARNWGSSGNRDSFRTLEREAAKVGPGSGGLVFLPYLSGELHPILDARARAVFCGVSLEHRRGHIVRSLMEGSALAIRHNLSVAEAAGARVEKIFATGGPTHSKLWCQIIADVTGRPLAVTDSGAPEGDALLAGWGVGLGPDPVEVVRRNRRKARPVKPEKSYYPAYDKLFSVYQNIYARLKDQFPILCEVREMDSKAGRRRARP